MAVKRLLIDTCAYSEFKRGHHGITEEIASSPNLILNPIVLGELRAGFAAGVRRANNEAELQYFVDSPRVEVLPIDEETSVFYAQIHLTLRKAGRPIPTNDLWIAASAMQYGCVLLTMDRHFEKVAQIIVRRYDPLAT